MATDYYIIIKSPKYAAMAQVVEHVLGKDEVTSSNLVSSSRKNLVRKNEVFSMKFALRRVRYANAYEIASL